MRFLRNLAVAAIITGAGYGYFKSRQTPTGTGGWREWIPDVLEPASSAPVSGPLVSDPAELFRFDIRPDWVLHNWSRVSTGLSDPRYAGYRVPVVTGTTEQDLAGALSYYFDEQERLRRITFVGATGDPRHLAAWVTRQFGFQRFGKPGEGLTYVAARSSRYRGVLRMAPKAIVSEADTTQAYDVELIVER
ncbi:MAG: hypothetical protein HY000_19575 [Planctomycetes bacterium]|nr:hypothetical protein [Planctomycetota bacterium]